MIKGIYVRNRYRHGRLNETYSNYSGRFSTKYILQLTVNAAESLLTVFFKLGPIRLARRGFDYSSHQGNALDLVYLR